MNGEQWVLCPACQGKTRLKVREDTVLFRLPLFCPKCRREMLVNVKKMNVSIIKEPVAFVQSR